MAIPSWFDPDTPGPQSPQAPAGGAPSGNVPAPGTMTPLSSVGRDPRFTSNRAPRVQQDAQGQWTLTEHGNTRYLQPNEVQDATNYANQFWTDNPQGFQLQNPLTVGDAYQQFYGRAPTAAELTSYQGYRGGPGGALNSVIYGTEANQRRNAVRETGPPPGMSMEAWLEGEAYLNRIDPGRQSRPGGTGLPAAATYPRPSNAVLGEVGQGSGMSFELALQRGVIDPFGRPTGQARLRAPDGTVKAVPFDQVQFYLSRGATWA